MKRLIDSVCCVSFTLLITSVCHWIISNKYSTLNVLFRVLWENVLNVFNVLFFFERVKFKNSPSKTCKTCERLEVAKVTCVKREYGSRQLDIWHYEVGVGEGGRWPANKTLWQSSIRWPGQILPIESNDASV